MHLLVADQQLLAASGIPDEQFAVDEDVATHLIEAEEAIKFSRIGRPIRQEPDPDGGVDEDDHAFEGRARDGGSRRLAVERARGSEPRSVRRRS